MSKDANQNGQVPTPSDFFSWLSSAADPLSAWKNTGQLGEQAWGEALQKMVGTPDFARNLGQQASTTAAQRALIKQAAQAYLEAANMPSRDDLTRLAEQIVTLDAKLDDNEDALRLELDKLARMLSRLLSLAEGLDKRLAQLETPAPSNEKLSALEARLADLEKRLASPKPARKSKAADHD